MYLVFKCIPFSELTTSPFRLIPFATALIVFDKRLKRTEKDAQTAALKSEDKNKSIQYGDNSVQLSKR